MKGYLQNLRYISIATAPDLVRQRGLGGFPHERLSNPKGDWQVRSRVETLSLEQLENLGEALLDFTSMADLQAWLEALRGEDEQ